MLGIGEVHALDGRRDPVALGIVTRFVNGCFIDHGEVGAVDAVAEQRLTSDGACVSGSQSSDKKESTGRSTKGDHLICSKTSKKMTKNGWSKK